MELPQAFQFLGWCEKILGLVGVWPHNPINTRSILIIGFFIIHVSLEYADLIQFLNNLEHVVVTLSQCVPLTVVILKLVSLRWNSQELGKVIDAMREDLHAANYRTPKEMKIFMERYKTARRIVAAIIPLVFFMPTYIYVAPLIDILTNMYKNETVELRLPFQVRLFWDVTEVPAYTLTYLSQLPCNIGVLAYSGSDYLLVTAILHICGQLSVLVERINNLSTDHEKCGPAIEEVAKMHVRLIWMAVTLREAYSLILLAQVFGGMLLICIVPYDFLVSLKKGHELISADFFHCLNHIICEAIVLFAYCYAGETLITESSRVHRAFGECGWEDMPVRHAKSIIISMARSEQPLGLSAGKFIELSLSSFTDMMKSSMAYFSVLRETLL